MVTVPARGTSKLCPGCLGTLTHHPAPDRLAERGWKWAHCTGCGLSMDRDHAAARRIVSRGLLAQTHTTTDRATDTRTIRTTVDGTVTLVRRPKKTTRRLRRSATRSRPRPGRADRRPPRARATPPPAGPPAPGAEAPGAPPKARSRARRLPAVCPMCVRSPPPPPPGRSSVRRGMTPRHQPHPGRCQVMEYPHPTRPKKTFFRPAGGGSHAEPVDDAPAPPSGPASTTCTPPKSTPSPRGSDHRTATAHGHAAPEKPGNHRHTQSSRDAGNAQFSSRTVTRFDQQ